MPFQLGGTELLILLVIVLFVFGVGKLPEVGAALGKGIRDFRKSLSEPNEAGTTEDSRHS
ncbi:MAG: twin-arginine translocation pathway protein, TatA/TatE family [Dehalococcoidia bacterium]|nr:twin-arginine translocation pathway protein, TatA/TatE family [Dehalococcoidia bacterium]